MKKLVVISVLVLIALPIANLESPAIPSIDACTALLIGLAQAKLYYDTCVLYYGTSGCGYYADLVSQQRALVAQWCGIEVS